MTIPLDNDESTETPTSTEADVGEASSVGETGFVGETGSVGETAAGGEESVAETDLLAELLREKDALQDRLARSLAQTRAVRAKEIFETFEFFAAVRKRVRAAHKDRVQPWDVEALLKLK